MSFQMPRRHLRLVAAAAAAAATTIATTTAEKGLLLFSSTSILFTAFLPLKLHHVGNTK